jgi:cytochrome c553
MQCIGVVVDARDSKHMQLLAAHASSSRKAPGEESLQRGKRRRGRGYREGERKSDAMKAQRLLVK